MFRPIAKVLADSCFGGSRLTTLEVTFHRYVLAEFNTHRAFSRNGASSRAIPVSHLINKVIDSRVQPLEWGKNQKGMSASEELNDATQQMAWETWELAKQDAIHAAEVLTELGVHKQIVNRLLEPFLPMTMIVTSLYTGYTNFLEQRLHPAAQPEIRELAKVMKFALDNSHPLKLSYGDWHIPYRGDDAFVSPSLLLACVGRCARVSYLNHNGSKSHDDDVRLGSKLLLAEPPHLSPFEHIAVVNEIQTKSNFAGSAFLQLRHNTPKLQELCEYGN
jgi:thymidylate synthase ThyX